MMAVAFRNVDVPTDAPVEDWGFEGVLAAVDRGDLSDWRRLAAAVAGGPRGGFVDLLEEVLDAAEDVGAAAVLRGYIALTLQRQEQRERAAVAAELTSLWKASGLDQATYASRLGTSRSRLNTYLNGRTVPLATFLVRARELAAHHTNAP